MATRTFFQWCKPLQLPFKHPLAKSIMITTSGFGVSDIACQCIEYRMKSRHGTAHSSFVWDKKRTVNFSIIGFLFGPQFHCWMPFVVKSIPGTTVEVTLKRVFVDQCVFSSWATVFVLCTSQILEGHGIRSGIQNVRDNFVDAYSKACCIFPPGQFINYFLIPPRYRVLWLNGIGFLWRVIVSYILYGKPETQVNTLQEQNTALQL
mmetsp:Transcript_34118/g.55620  ORF Transcript_34118/g.55620 Transcript_34118/m.55620 type:complete len:206 (+) Transcript_34118:23-640(+)